MVPNLLFNVQQCISGVPMSEVIDKTRSIAVSNFPEDLIWLEYCSVFFAFQLSFFDAKQKLEANWMDGQMILAKAAWELPNLVYIDPMQIGLGNAP